MNTYYTVRSNLPLTLLGKATDYKSQFNAEDGEDNDYQDTNFTIAVFP